MLKIENHKNLKGDFIEYKEYTIYIDSVYEQKDHYKIIVGLKQNNKLEDYIGVELSRQPKQNGNYILTQPAMPTNFTDVTLSCIKNLDWFGYMTCKMIGERNWQMKIPGYNHKQPQKKLK